MRRTGEVSLTEGASRRMASASSVVRSLRWRSATDGMRANFGSNFVTQIVFEPSSSICEMKKLFNPDRKSTRLNSSHANISYAVFCLKKKNKIKTIKSHHTTRKPTEY